MCSFFFFNDTATTEIYTLSLHDALPIWFHADRGDSGRGYSGHACAGGGHRAASANRKPGRAAFDIQPDRKSTRLNSSHSQISYAVFCLKKKKITTDNAHDADVEIY